ncbi:hypothetical protein EDD69_1303 [Thermolongibacillus altinsuensis]|uniref:Uncharacterized protein n=1 Tax=Thermolongibacillus altinsuensis TaxID=575256 RepID=A0A4R1Q9G4_9BACL|nr:hypothetical protein [Thermolongibacillus altinsuensis]TCL43132.1 hypothetical protein EDD69_1303 [Thermolongibacillus altinsuensis]
MKNIGRILISAALLFSISSYAYAASSPSGSATYREGGTLNTHDHAGIMKNSSTVYEIKGYNYKVDESSLTSFKDGKTYYGTFKTSSLTSTQRDSILSTAEALDNDPEITYTMYDQLNWESNAGDYISVSEITDIRCDGVVEYAYEWNNIWVWGRSSTGTASGNPTHHDISYTAYASEHANLGSDAPWIEVSPKVQRGAAPCGCDPYKWTTLRKE